MNKTQIIAEPDTQQITITREFAAPRTLVFRAYTEPELLAQWLGPRELTMTIDHMEVRDGGRWRYTHHDAAGNAFGFHGVYHGTPSMEGIVQTFEYEGTPGHVALETLTFDERDGTTLVRTNSIYQSVADRDVMLASGMESGVNDSMERLDELLPTLMSDERPPMDWKLEVVVIPVSDVERAKHFYSEQVGFVVDVDRQMSDTFRVVQMTPPGSACSVTIGVGMNAMPPGSLKGLQLVVADIEAAHTELTGRGVPVSTIKHFDNGVQAEGPGGDWNSFIFFDDPDGNSWAVQQAPARG